MLWRQPAQAGLTDDTMQHVVGGSIRLAAFWRLSDRAPRSFVTRPPGPERVMFLGEYLGSQLSARCVSNKTMLSIRLASTGRSTVLAGYGEIGFLPLASNKGGWVGALCLSTFYLGK